MPPWLTPPFTFFIVCAILLVLNDFRLARKGRAVDRANFLAWQRWYLLPTFDEYSQQLDAHLRGTGGVCKCGSRSLKNWGLASRNDDRRILRCNHCGEQVYRLGTRSPQHDAIARDTLLEKAPKGSNIKVFTTGTQ